MKQAQLTESEILRKPAPFRVRFEPILPLQSLNQPLSLNKKISRFFKKLKTAIQRAEKI